MKHIFYLIGVAFIISEAMWILNPKEQAEKTKNFLRHHKINKRKKWEEMSSAYQELLKGKIISLLLFVWVFIGLLSFNWFAFLVFIIFQFVIISPISKLTRFNVVYLALHWVNSVIGFAFGLFVIINSYHLKIDLYQLFLDYIN